MTTPSRTAAFAAQAAKSTSPATPATTRRGPVELKPHQLALVAGGSPKGGWTCLPGEVTTSPKGGWA